MPTLRFALAQMDFPVGAVAANAARMRTLTAAARDGGAALVAFPELAICGYPPEDLLLRPSFLAACAREIDALAAATNGVAAYVGHPHAQGEVYNAGSLLRGGAIEVTYHKQALPNYTVFDEKRYFRPGHEAQVVEIGGVRVGLLVCEDIWEAEPAPISSPGLPGEVSVESSTLTEGARSRSKQPSTPCNTPETRRLTYADLQSQTSKLASALESLGVKKGDVVTIYMGMVPELAVACLACARIGAAHSVIFGGFSAHAIVDRVIDAKSKVIIT